MSSPPYTTKKVLLYGQMVEVKVYPPKPTPEPGITAAPTTRAHISAVDTTVTETGGRRRGKRKDP